MRIVLFIDSLTSGGAQRQLVALAKLLAGNGHDIVVLSYYPYNFFKNQLLEAAGIKVFCIEEWNGQFSRLFKVRRFLSDHRPDCVIAFLYIPCFIAELCRLLPGHRYRLIASERNTDIRAPGINGWIRLIMHGLSNIVVANSYSQAEFLKRYAPWLIKKVTVISNCLDLDHFSTRSTIGRLNPGCTQIRLVTVGRYEAQKNGIKLVEGLAEYIRNRQNLPEVYIEWYGNDPNPESGLYDEMKQRIMDLRIVKYFCLNPAVEDVLSLYHKADALCLVSLHEGCANVVCEAIACGLPVIASPAGDNERMVKDSENGIIVDGFSQEKIAQAIGRFAKLTDAERHSMGKVSREIAESLLSENKFLKKWLKVVC